MNEGFKDDMYRLYPDAKDDSSFNNAIKDYNSSDNKIKELVKRKISINGNVAKSIKELYPNAEDFVKFIDSLTQSIKDKEEYKEIKKGNAKSNSKDFWLIPCHTSEEAHKAASMYSGGLPRLSNEEIEKEYGIKAPKSATMYKTDKTPEEFLEIMKNEKRFFMTPSWCVAGSENGSYYFDRYQLNTKQNEPAKMYVIISKAFPNVRFAITLKQNMICRDNGIDMEGKIGECRDTWQTGDKQETGLRMMRAMFGKDVIDKIINDILSKISVKDINNKIVDVDKISGMRESIDSMDDRFVMNVDFPNLENGESMFSNIGLRSFNGKLPKLMNGKKMFSVNGITSFENDLPNLTNGSHMFEGCSKLKSFKSKTPSLKNGYGMFARCYSLTDFDGDLSSLERGDYMFYCCPLTRESIENILRTIATHPYDENGRKRKLDIGFHNSITSQERLNYRKRFKEKGWEVFAL